MRLAFPLSLIATLSLFACGGGDIPGDVDGGVPDAGTGADAPLDAATMCPDPLPPVCDYFLSCGCDTGVGEKCTATNTGPACGPSGPKTAGESCNSDPECEPTTMCALFGGATSCRSFCDDSHPCEGGEVCYLRIVDQDANDIGRLCGPTCSLLGQDCPTATLGCYTSTLVEEMEKGICATAGMGGQGDPCTRSNDCAQGFLCVTPEGAMDSICAQVCDRNAASPGCPAMTECRPLVGHTQTGICLPL